MGPILGLALAALVHQPPHASPVCTHGGQDIIKYLIDLSAKSCKPVPKLSNETLLKKIFSSSIFLILTTGLLQQLLPAKIAAEE